MSPADDTFMSGSADNTVRLWDLRSPTCSGIMHVQASQMGQAQIRLSRREWEIVYDILINWIHVLVIMAVSWSQHITEESYHFFQGKPVLSFDPEGLVFSVGVQSEQVESKLRFYITSCII